MRANPDQGQRPVSPAGQDIPDRSPGRRAPAGGRRSALGRWVRRFAQDEAGTVTVESLLWIIFFFWVLALITDVSLAFFAKAEAFRIIQNGNRLYSISRLDTPAEVETFIEGSYDHQSANADATTTITTVDDVETIVSTAMTIPIPEVMLFNVFNASNSWVMTVGSQHYIEWGN